MSHNLISLGLGQGCTCIGYCLILLDNWEFLEF